MPGNVENVITGLAHAGVCVADCEAAVEFYRDVLGLRVLSPPYIMSGNAIHDDMGEPVSDPAMKASAIADVARVRTTWFADPWGVVFILVEKSRPGRPYFAQFGA